MIAIHVFADSREPDWSDNKTIVIPAEQLDATLLELARRDWHHPVLLVWKLPGDNKWSHWVLTKQVGEDWLKSQEQGEEKEE